MSYNYTYNKRRETPILDYFVMANHGMIDGHSTSTKFGYNLDFQSEETIWPLGGEFDPLSVTGAETVTVTSSSSEDTNITGTGAWLVAIFGLDENYNEVEELTLALDGTNGVTSANSYRAINRVAVAYSGSSDSNVGNLTIAQSSSGINLAYIPIGESITQQCIYTVPAGKSAYIQGFFFTATKAGGGGQPVIEFEVYSYNPASDTRYLVKDIFLDTQRESTIYTPQITANPSGEKTTLVINASSDTATSKAFCNFFLALVDNK